MKRTDPELIGDVLRQTLQQHNLNERLYETRAVALWPSIIGEEIARLTSKPTVRNGVMTLHVDAAPLRNELNMNRASIIRIINDSLGREVIKEIYFR